MLVYAGANTGAVTRIGQYTPLHIWRPERATSPRCAALLQRWRDRRPRGRRTSGVTPLHLAATAGRPRVVAALLDAKADINAKENEWGQTPLIFAASQDRVEAVKLLLARGADPNVTTKTIDLAEAHPRSNARRVSARRRSSKRRPARGSKPTPSQIQAAVQASARAATRPASCPQPEKPAARRPANAGGQGFDQGGQQMFFEETPGLSAKGGLTALLHAARQGYLATAHGPRRRRRRRRTRQRRRRHDAAADGGDQRPVRHGAAAASSTAPIRTCAATGNGVTPLWAAVNTQWQPRTRFPQPQEMELQKATYLDVMKALLEKGADPNAPHPVASLVHGLQRLRQPQLRPRRQRRARPRSGARRTRPTSRRCGCWSSTAPIPNIPTDGAAAARRGAVRRKAAGPGSDGVEASGAVSRGADPGRARRPIPYGGPRRLARFTPPPASSTARASPATRIATRPTAGCRR